MKELIALMVVLFGAFGIEVSAQTILVNNKIPDDLLISVKRQGGWGGNYNEVTLNAKGEFLFEARPTFPMSSPTELFVAGKRLKNPKYLTPKLSPEKLKALIGEFEKVQFFRFGKDFPAEDEKNGMGVTDQQTEIISIRINGQTKEVSNYLGDNLNRTRILRELAERVRGASVWNFENGELPEIFEIWYRETDGGKILRDLKINRKGEIIESFHESRFYPDLKKDLPVFIKSKTVGKISKLKLRELLDEFEKDVFSMFKYSILTKYAGCANDAGANESKRKHIHLQINRVLQIYGSLYKDCNPLPETDAARFEYMDKVLTDLFKDSGIFK